MSTETEKAPEKPVETKPAVVQPQPVQRLVSTDDTENATLLDTAKFEQSQRLAMAMARASLTPKHLRGADINEGQANCLRIVNQALRWGMDPFAIMDETYVVSGKLGYGGKLIAAVINSRLGTGERLQCFYNDAKGDDFAVVIFTGKPDAAAFEILAAYAEKGERKLLRELTSVGIRAIHLSVGQAKTQNDMWKKDPEQKLWYSGATKWARRYAPEIVLGVATDDDFDRMAEPPTPRTESLADRIALSTGRGTDSASANGNGKHEPEMVGAGATNGKLFGGDDADLDAQAK